MRPCKTARARRRDGEPGGRCDAVAPESAGSAIEGGTGAPRTGPEAPRCRGLAIRLRRGPLHPTIGRMVLNHGGRKGTRSGGTRGEGPARRLAAASTRPTRKIQDFDRASRTARNPPVAPFRRAARWHAWCKTGGILGEAGGTLHRNSAIRLSVPSQQPVADGRDGSGGRPAGRPLSAPGEPMSAGPPPASPPTPHSAAASVAAVAPFHQ